MKKSLLNHPAIKPNIKKVEGLDGPDIFVKTIPANMIDDIQMLFDSEQKDSDVQISLCIVCACDEKGSYLFSNTDRETLAESPLDTIKSIAEAAMDLNGFMNDQVEEEVKN